MSRDELLTRMAERAKLERLRAFRLAKGLGFAVSSHSRRGELYLVRVYGTQLVCSCDAYAHFRDCKHCMAARRRRDRDARRQRAA